MYGFVPTVEQIVKAEKGIFGESYKTVGTVVANIISSRLMKPPCGKGCR